MAKDPDSFEIVYWSTHAPRRSRVVIEDIPWFSARGMKRVYGRGDHFWRMAAFNMDIWKNRHGLLFARFWSRSEEVEDRSLSLAIHGHPWPEAGNDTAI
jgi:hypothetical protein